MSQTKKRSDKKRQYRRLPAQKCSNHTHQGRISKPHRLTPEQDTSYDPEKKDQPETGQNSCQSNP